MSQVIYTQCRFCLRLVDQMELFSICSDDRSSPLLSYVQQMLEVELTPENAQICNHCFSMWHMMQDFLNACSQSNKILMSNNRVFIRTSWTGSDEEEQMFIGVCRLVKKHYHEMEQLVKSLEKKETDKLKTVKKTALKKTKEAQNGSITVENESMPNIIKEEDPLDIDDSSAFLTEEPPAATERFTIQVGSTQTEQEQLPASLHVEANESLEDAVTIVEPKIDHIDLVDSSSSSEEEEEEDESEESSVSSAHIDEETLKTVCQICGEKTTRMAAHLEMHIKRRKIQYKCIEKPVVRPRKESPTPTALFKCKVCTAKLATPLAAKIHSRIHPVHGFENVPIVRR